MERRLPDEAPIILQFHAEKWVRERCEVVVVDASDQKSGRDANLADIILDRELLSPERERLPFRVVDGVVWH